MKTLTKAEEQVMKVLWKLQQGMLMDIVEAMPRPQPHKNTVATILKTLVDKDFVDIEPIGRYHRYKPAVSIEAYSKRSLTNIITGYFGGNFSNAVSFMIHEGDLSVSEIELLLKQVKRTKK